MENLIREGEIDGVLDFTTTELADELVGGVLSAGPNRLEAAGANRIPQVVSTGALDMVNFGVYESVPKEFADRNLHRHNPTVTLLRTNVKENRELGRILAEKVNEAAGPVAVGLPLNGVSQIDVEGEDFYDSEADKALYEAIREHLDSSVELIEMENNINDEEFAITLAQRLDQLLTESS
jgi:uncharacterized protein (UPF0261 family)